MSLKAVDDDHATIKSLLDALASSSGEQTHLIDPANGQALTYRESHTRVLKVAKVIAALGIEAKDPVAYAFSNSADAAVTILGILYGGYLATAINLVAGVGTIEYVLEHSGAKLVIVDEDARALIDQALSSHKNPPKILGLDELLAVEVGSEQRLKDTSASDDSLLMYTSGTTGRPKGVIHTQRSLLCGGRNTAQAHKLTANDRGMCVLPFYHINAFCVSLMGSLVTGGSLVIPSKFSVSSFWETIQHHHCSWFSVVPTQISYLLHNTGSSSGTNNAANNGAQQAGRLRFGRSASAPLSPDMHAAFEKRFGVPIIETMGLTETAAQILSNPLPPKTRKIGSPGIAFGNEVIIADSEQNVLPPGQEGEILVRGPNVLREYLKNPEATKETITPSGWLRTGDLGRMDEDGYVFVTGRLKELIIKGGENIAPREVDEALYSHPDVIEAAAFAVPCNNYGQRVEAGVKLKDTSQVTADALLELCREKLGTFKAPDKIHFLAELPKGPSGKIQRVKLADAIAAPVSV